MFERPEETEVENLGNKVILTLVSIWLGLFWLGFGFGFLVGFLVGRA